MWFIARTYLCLLFMLGSGCAFSRLFVWCLFDFSFAGWFWIWIYCRFGGLHLLVVLAWLCCLALIDGFVANFARFLSCFVRAIWLLLVWFCCWMHCLLVLGFMWDQVCYSWILLGLGSGLICVCVLSCLFCVLVGLCGLCFAGFCFVGIADFFRDLLYLVGLVFGV